ncbi:Phytochrome-like protein cph2 [Anaerolineales bacterium]|nr:Phytochrome-like protein cph2 [Anaerolineales bacterium]
MTQRSEKQSNIFHHAWEIINKDDSIPPEEKKGIMKLIQTLVEVAEGSPRRGEGDSEDTLYTQDVISKHSLMTLVKQQADELNSLRSLSLNLTSSLDLQTVLDAVVTEAMRLIKNARNAHIFLYSHGTLSFGASLNAGGEKNKPIAMPRQDGLTYFVANSGEKLIVEDMAHHPIYKDAPKEWGGSIIGVPLKFKNSIVGVMSLSRSTTGGFTRAELRLIGLLADQAAVAISNASLHKIVAEQANTDILTGLPNRRALDDRLQEDIRHAKRMRTQFSVVMMDLDGFKSVNDIHGHVVGDEVLHSVFNHLSYNVRPTDFLARYGGDELTLIVRDAGLEAAQTVTAKLIGLMNGFDFPFPGGKKVKLGITAGIAVYPIHASNAGDLLRAADAALYQGKKHNRGSFVMAKGVTGPLRPINIPQDKK